MLTRRGLLAGILGSGLAPAILRSDIIMPVRKIVVPDWHQWCGVDFGADEGVVICTMEVGRLERFRIIETARMPSGKQLAVDLRRYRLT